MTNRFPWSTSLALAAAVALLLTPLPAISESLLGLALLNTLHLPFFFALTLATHTILTRIRPSWPVAGSLVALAAFGVVSELAQILTGRTASLADLFNNGLGIALAGAVLWTPSPRSRKQRFALAAAGILGASISLVPAINIAIATYHRNQAFPRLGDFENDRELAFWFVQGHRDGHWTQMSRSSDFASSGQFSLEITTVAAPWAGVHHLPAPTPIPTASNLHFTISNPGSNFQLGIRLDLEIGNETKRSNHQITVRSGVADYQIPLLSPEIQATLPKTADRSKPTKTVVEKLIFHRGERPVFSHFSLDSVYFKYSP